MDNRVRIVQVPEDELLEKIQQLVRATIRDELKAQRDEEAETKLVSPAEACKLFQPAITKATLSKWVKDGKIQDYRIGSRVFYRQADIINSLQALKKYKRSV